MHSSVTTLTHQAADRRRWIALLIVCLAQLMIVLDTTIVNVALPSIQSDLHFAQGNLTWVVDAYLITFGGLLLLAGTMGDLVGRKKGLPRRPPVHGRLDRHAGWHRARGCAGRLVRA